MKKAFLAIKFHEDGKNRELIEGLCKVLEEAGFETRNVIREYENWGKIKLGPEKLMRLTFEEIDKADFFILELSEKGVGLGIEAGYAFSKNKPIIVLAKEGSDISTTIKGISKQVILYNHINEIPTKLRDILSP